jgi:6-phosphogluconolactonase
LSFELRCYPDVAALSRAAAEEVRARVVAAVAARGRCLLALSGGSTPRRLYELLAAPASRERIAWKQVELFWSDERAVAPEHASSNFRMAREALLEPLGIAREQIHRMPAERPDLDAAARAHQAELARVAGIPPDAAPPRFDLILLGMGADGHTASLFPDTAALCERERWIVPGRAPVEPHERLSFSFRTLNAARCLLLLVAGADKAETLARVLEGERDPRRFPCQSLAPSDGEILWLVDAAAASRLARTGATPEGQGVS